ncbi:MAG TPA: peptide chain release factor N(5)-glutamine methyltransferase [Blastocatellia bacterium]|nr:peptide chain release factor N(5)-glutamine methyltransferase [Blastocatellia bacterium]
MTTLEEAVSSGASLLAGTDQPNSRRTARLLLSHLLGTDQTAVLARSKDRLSDQDFDNYISLVRRRASGEPLQYITGHQEFHGLDFKVTPDVLIPRPETEFAVERILKLAGARPSQENRDSYSESADDPDPDGVPLIVDLGTGSGCIAITLVLNVPTAFVIATDISDAALRVARGNAARLGVTQRISFVQGDLLAPIANREAAGGVDFIVCNPPYIPASQRDLLQREVREHEPPAALYGGDDGLSFFRRLFIESSPVVKPGGVLIVELGYLQLDPVRRLIDPADWEVLDVTEDLQGIPRVLAAKRT